MKSSSANGFALAEHSLTIVLSSLLVIILSSAISLSTRKSADPLIRHQALAIAEAYVEEIIGSDYSDPDSDLICDQEASRAQFDNICDYDALSDNGARSIDGSLIAGLEDYQVDVSITYDGSTSLNGLSGRRNNQPLFMRIDVRVRWQELVDLTLSAYESSPRQ